MTRCSLALTCALLLSANLAQPTDDEWLARALVPLLEGLGANRISVEPGSAPPSPITGRHSTLISVRIGIRTLQIEPEVLEVMKRLQSWSDRRPLSPADRALALAWADHVQVRMMARLAARGMSLDCNPACLVQHLRAPDLLFGDTRREQEEARNDLLLTALSDSMKQ